MADSIDNGIDQEINQGWYRWPGYAIWLARPIYRKATTLCRIQLGLLDAEALKGVSIERLWRTEIDELTTVLQRISRPHLRRKEAQDLDPSDLTQCALYIAELLQCLFQYEAEAAQAAQRSQR